MKQVNHYNLLLSSILLGLLVFGAPLFQGQLFAQNVAPGCMKDATPGNQCSDGKDNDCDGYADWEGVKTGDTVRYHPDAACSNPDDINEFDETSGSIIPCTDKCGLNDVFRLINNIINFVITRLFFPFFIFIILFIGYKYISAGGNSGKVASVKKMIRNVVIGVLLVLGAWLLVRSALNLIGYKESLIFFD